jgi:DNA-directed RNA polymerase subunit K/omega
MLSRETDINKYELVLSNAHWFATIQFSNIVTEPDQKLLLVAFMEFAKEVLDPGSPNLPIEEQS